MPVSSSEGKTSRKRYKYFDRIPEGFTRQIPLFKVKAGDEIVWTDAAPVSVITRIELAGTPGQKARSYRIESRPKDAPRDAEPYWEIVGSTSKLFIKQQ